MADREKILATPSEVHASGAVQFCVDAIRKLIGNGELLPGQQVHQVPLAEKLQVSRVPVREALSILRSEGVLDYTRNAGYRVARFSLNELKQVFLMRNELEPLLLRSLSPFTPVDIKLMRGINRRIETAARTGDLASFAVLNREFHFAIFSLSPHKLVLAEIERLWNLYEVHASFYRTVRVHDTRVRKLVVQEHNEIIAAAAKGDLDGVVRLTSKHRSGARRDLDRLLSQQSPALSFSAADGGKPW